MRWYYILAIVVLVLFLIGQIRVGARAEYNAQGFLAWLRLGPLNIKVFPLAKKGERKPKRKKEKAEKPAGKKPKKPVGETSGKPAEAKPGKPAGEKPKKAAEEKPGKPVLEKVGGALDYAMALLPIALDAGAQFGRKLQIDVLRLELTAGAEDPADAAIRYGQAVAALGAFWTPLTHAFRVKDGEARALVDFGSSSMTLYGAAALSLKIGQIVRLGLWAGWRALWAFLGVRREHRREKRDNFSVKV